MKHAKTLLLALLLIFGASSLGWTNGFNLNSIGSRALSMGGAFVGLADDYSAVFWNPAGLAQFNRRVVGFYGSDIIPKGSYLFQRPTDEGLLTVVDAKTRTKHYLSGMLAYYQPVNESLVAGIGLYVPAGLGAAWNGEDFRFLTNNVAYLWESHIGMITLSPAIAYKVNDMVSVGAALNLNYGMFSVKTHAGTVEIPVPPGQLDLGQYDESLNGWGFGATFGVLVKPNKTLSFGATIRTPSKIKLNGDVSIENLDLLGPNFKNSSDASRDVTWPWWIAAGVAYRPRQDLTLTFDLQWTQWSREQEIETRFKDPYWSLLMQESGDNILPLKWEDALQVRFGAEYQLYQNVAIRAGYYYDPTPAPEKTTNVLIPSYTFNAFTLGLGYDLSGLVIDFGFEMLFGKTRGVDFAKWLLDPAWESSMPGVYKMNLFVPTIAVSYKF